MKFIQLIRLLLLILLVTGCKHHEEMQPTTSSLAGNWSGTYDTQQAGSCTWSGAASVPTTASWQVNGNNVTGTINRQFGQVSSPTQLTGTVSGNSVQMAETTANNVLCNGIGRSFFSRYTGNIMGNTLSLVSLDTLCPDQGCVFRRTLNLTRQ